MSPPEEGDANNHTESQGRDWPGRMGAVQTRPWPSSIWPHPYQDTASNPPGFWQKYL